MPIADQAVIGDRGHVLGDVVFLQAAGLGVEKMPGLPMPFPAGLALFFGDEFRRRRECDQVLQLREDRLFFGDRGEVLGEGFRDFLGCGAGFCAGCWARLEGAVTTSTPWPIS